MMTKAERDKLRAWWTGHDGSISFEEDDGELGLKLLADLDALEQENAALKARVEELEAEVNLCHHAIENHSLHLYLVPKAKLWEAEKKRDALATTIEHQEKRIKELRELAHDCWLQWAYENEDGLWCGGLSTLESLERELFDTYFCKHPRDEALAPPKPDKENDDASKEW